MKINIFLLESCNRTVTGWKCVNTSKMWHNNCRIKQMEYILMMLFLKRGHSSKSYPVAQFSFSQVYFGHGSFSGSHDGQNWR